MLKSWTKNGTETLTILPQSRGYACVAAIQPWCITRWSLVISFFIYKAESFSLNLRLRCDFQLRRILPFQSSSFVAIARGDIAYLQQQLSAGELALTDCGNRGFTLLHLAVRYSQLPIISMLINQGLDVNSVNDLGETPLHTAVQQSSNYECVRHLLDNGADLGRQDMKGRTPLHGYYNNISQQILLFNQDEVDPWIQDSQGMTILHWVSRSRKSTLQSLLLSSPLQQANTASPFKLKDIQGKSMLHYAVQRGNLELINFFLASPYADSMSMPDHLGRTLLHYATESSQVGIVIDLLLERGLDLNAEDDNRYTVMHHAAMRDNATAQITRSRTYF
ncbi:ankyrin [Amniculicola lignicola CBS 123094]|uniref:Ankyrin n=1 Tax=Amniculicola lignicola CBS 123094 TaxID=1392246 RepID=A0A6A5X3R1_9PLEO|nr:ankyrin [Amniculicola lignicola CBS 123094]